MNLDIEEAKVGAISFLKCNFDKAKRTGGMRDKSIVDYWRQSFSRTAIQNQFKKGNITRHQRDFLLSPTGPKLNQNSSSHIHSLAHMSESEVQALV